MLSTLISRHVESWFQQPTCPARALIEHIRQRKFFRDAQIEAIKTYLFLKIEGGNRPLWQMFCEGFFTPDEDLSRHHISQPARDFFETDTAARALYAFARIPSSDGNRSSLPILEKHLCENPGKADCMDVVKQIFYGVEYPDYLFSLPMGAGKTFLMAAFIYLDLYFAQNEPQNKLWAHNFILLVPSGLKSSILPSLKTIENFDATNVLPEPAASNIRKLIRFEMLDQPKSANKSNKARNPNAVKVSGHQPFADLMGLVLVTNAEKVVLDRLQISAQGVLLDQTDDEKDKYANELRNLIGKIPNLQILIDEVHHAATDDIKLRQVVNSWSRGGNINGVLGFSGTPYLASPDAVVVEPGVSLKVPQITNTVFYWPLTRAIQSFLKKPTVRTISEVSSSAIVRRGVTDFLKQYGELVYSAGQTAKLAIYCGTIERLEQEVFPLLLELGLPADDILKYHRGNKEFPAPAGAEAEWKKLDTNLSRVRVVLLVQIGKEGWDCRSLTGVILSQKGDCPTNMVLQTSCRCLRQMDGSSPDGTSETAGIWLNADNARILDKQLAEEQHTSIAEINALGKTGTAPDMRTRFSRVHVLKLPRIDFYQMRVTYDTLTTAGATPDKTLSLLDTAPFFSKAEVLTRELSASAAVSRRFLEDEQGDTSDFAGWLSDISKGSFGAIALTDLRAHEPDLRRIFEAVTVVDKTGVRHFNDLYDLSAIAEHVRLAFHNHRTLKTRSETLPIQARLLIVDNLHAVATDTSYLQPSEPEVVTIRELDAEGKTAHSFVQQQREKYQMAFDLLTANDLDPAGLKSPEKLSASVENKDRSFHYVPYHFDSSFEEKFITQALESDTLKDRNLELYFNGEGELTEFRIDCFARVGRSWSKVGLYTPDFLIIERRDAAIHRVLVVETKGVGFARNFASRRQFVETEWLKRNNDKFGYARFDFLYLEGDMAAEARFALDRKIKEFFTE